MKKLAAIAILAALLAVPAARADGDPASDYLLAQKVFFPYDLKVPTATQQQLAALVDEANRVGLHDPRRDRSEQLRPRLDHRAVAQAAASMRASSASS